MPAPDPNTPTTPKPGSPGGGVGYRQNPDPSTGFSWYWNGTDWVWTSPYGATEAKSEGTATPAQIGGDMSDPRSLEQILGLAPFLFADQGKNIPGAQLDTTQADQQRSDMQALVGQLQQQATTGDGAWQQSFSQAVQNAKAGVSAAGQAQGAEARSGYAGALRNIGNAKSAVDQRAVGEEAALRSQSEASAQDELAQLLAAQGQGDVAQSAAMAAVQQQRREADSALQANASQNASNFIGGVGQGIATVAAASKGGKVPGKPKVFGDDERNDIVPAWLSPGEIVVPRTKAGDPNKAAAFARAVAAGHVRKLAGGGDAWQPGDKDPTNLPSYGPFGVNTEAPSIDNGALLDTSQYAATRRQLNGVQNQLATRAGGSNGIADTISQQQQDQQVAQALQVENNRRASLADVMQAMASGGAKTAAGAGAKRQADQAAAQKTLGNLDVMRRAQELGLSEAQQQALWNNTLLNSGISLQNQALLRAQIAAAGQGAMQLANLGKGSETGVETPSATNSNPTTQAAADAAFNEPDAQPSAPGDYPIPDTSDGIGAAHGGRISFARAARMAKGGEAKPVAHLTILIPAPPPAMVVGDGRGLAQAARRMAGGGRVGKLTGRAVDSTEAEESGGDAPEPSFTTKLAKFAEHISHAAPASAAAMLPKSKPAPTAEPQTSPNPHQPRLRPPHSETPLDHPEDLQVQRAFGGAVPSYATGGATVEQSPLEKLAQAVQAGARIAKGYADGGDVGYGAYDPTALEPRRDTGSAPVPGPAPAAGPFVPGGGTSAFMAPTTNVRPGELPPALAKLAAEAEAKKGANRYAAPAGSTSSVPLTPEERAISQGMGAPHPPEPPAAKVLPPMRPPAVAAPVAPKAPPPAPRPAAADALSAPYAKAAPDAFEAEDKAIRASGEIAAEKGRAEADALAAFDARMKEHAANEQQMMKRAHEESSALMGHYKAAVDEMKNIDTSVDPGRFWASRNTGQKVFGIIGMALSSLGSRDGTNKAAELLGQAIDRDIDAQKANVNARLKKGEGALAAAQSAYAMNRQLFQDDLAATAATKASLLDLANNQIRTVAAMYSSPEAKARAEQLIAQNDEAKAKFEQQAQIQAADIALKRSQTAENYAQAAAARAKGAGAPSLVSPGYAATGAIKLGPEELAKFREGVANQSTLATQASELSNLISSSAQLQVGDNASRAKAIAAQMKSNLKEMEKLGALSKEDYALLDDQLPDPSAIFTLDSTKKAKLDQFTRELENRVAAHAGSLGLVRVGGRPMTQSQLEE